MQIVYPLKHKAVTQWIRPSNSPKYLETFEDLVNKIEELRLELIKRNEGRSYTDLEVIKASQALDEVLDRYQELILNKN